MAYRHDYYIEFEFMGGIKIYFVYRAEDNFFIGGARSYEGAEQLIKEIE